MDGQTFKKDSHAEALEVSCNDTLKQQWHLLRKKNNKKINFKKLSVQYYWW